VPEPARAPRALVFADTEFDRLDTATANLVEVAWAVEDNPVRCGVPPHSIVGADPKALEINRYFERDLGDKARWDRTILDHTARACAGQTLVAANPRVDADILARLIGYEPWHYRLCDIESVAFLLLGFEQMPGLREIKTKLTELGYQLPDPDHSAAGDVETLRAAFRILQRIARYLLRAGLPSPAELELAEHKVTLPAKAVYVGTEWHDFQGDQARCTGTLGDRHGELCLRPREAAIHQIRPRTS
jgi:hypothetical protein